MHVNTHSFLDLLYLFPHPFSAKISQMPQRSCVGWYIIAFSENSFLDHLARAQNRSKIVYCIHVIPEELFVDSSTRYISGHPQREAGHSHGRIGRLFDGSRLHWSVSRSGGGQNSYSWSAPVVADFQISQGSSSAASVVRVEVAWKHGGSDSPLNKQGIQYGRELDSLITINQPIID